MNYNDCLKIFNENYSLFDKSELRINSKYKHTFRVVKFAEEIAIEEGLSNEDIEFAKICALFHDIARFKQYTIYKTFVDEESFDHGDEGYNILKEMNITDNIILLSTKYHNKYKIPDDIDERTKLFCNITRDADKIDIMIEQGKICSDKEFYIDDEIINSFKEHKQLKNSLIDGKSTLYYMLRCIAFIFDMNFKSSLKIVKDSNEINLKFDEILSHFDEESIKEIRNICNEYLNERIDKNVRN